MPRFTYPDHAYLELDPETNEKRWYSTKGMGVCYVHEDRVAEAVAAEREACADLVLKRFETARDTEYDAGFEAARSTFALAIRARSNNSN